MKDLDIINGYIESIKEELMMYKDSLSEKSLEYICKLKKCYNHWERDLDEVNGITKQNKNEEKLDVEESTIDDSLYDAIDEFKAYIQYKNEYEETQSQEKLDMSRAELGHFLSLLSDIFDELHEHSKEDADERAMVKTTIKMIYQKFS